MPSADQHLKPPRQTVTDDLPCVGCGYNLRTLAWSSRCPECNRPVPDSAWLDGLRFSTPAGLRWARTGILLMVFGILLPILARTLFVILTLCAAPFWVALQAATSTPARLYRGSADAMRYADYVSLVLWTAAVAALVLPGYRQPRRWWRWLAGTVVIAATVGAAGILYESINILLQLPTIGPPNTSPLLAHGSALLFQLAALAAWVVLTLRFTRRQRYTRMLLWLATLTAVTYVLSTILSAAIALFGVHAAPLGGGIFEFPTPPAWQRQLTRSITYWHQYASGPSRLIQLLALWACLRVLNATSRDAAASRTA